MFASYILQACLVIYSNKGGNTKIFIFTTHYLMNIWQKIRKFVRNK